MGSVPTQFYEDVLHRIEAPVTQENLRACHAWQVAEGGNAAENPWNTTQNEPGNTFYNTFGAGYHVKNYPNYREGVDATVRTLLNGHYGAIVSAFRRGSDGHAVCAAVDSSVWGTHGAAATYQRIYGTSAPQYRLLVCGTKPPYMHGADVVQVQNRLIHYGAHLTVDGVYGPNTAKAVAAFQKSRHLIADGEVGPRTRAALGLPH